MTENKMKLHQVVAINDALTAVLAASNTLPAKLTFNLVKNKNSLNTNIEAFQKAGESSKEFREYEDERMKLCMELCDRDENNNPKFVNAIIGGQQMFSMTNGDNAKVFETKFTELKEKYKDALEEREAQLKDLETLLNTEIETNFTKISLNNIPDGSMTSKQLETLYPLIEE